MNGSPFKITLSPGKTAEFLGKIIVFLIVAHLSTHWLEGAPKHTFAAWLAPIFNLDVEGNVPTFFSVCLWMLNAALFFLIWKTRRSQQGWSAIWLILSVLFCYLAFDELTCIHEEATPFIRSILGTSGFLSFAWVIPYGLGCILLAVFFIPMVWRMDPKILLWFAAAAITFAAGSIGLEMCEGRYLDHHPGDIGYFWLMTLEESLEMIGLAMLAYASLRVMEVECEAVSIHLPGARNNSRST